MQQYKWFTVLYNKKLTDYKQQANVATECTYNFNIFTVVNAFTAWWLNNVVNDNLINALNETICLLKQCVQVQHSQFLFLNTVASHVLNFDINPVQNKRVSVSFGLRSSELCLL